MANRYISYERLEEGACKPAGTLGKHHCTVWVGKSMKIVTSYRGDKRIIMKPGDTLGYNCGEIWRVPSPSEYKDPIKQYLVERKISSKIIKMVDQLPFEIFPELVDNSYGTTVSIHGYSRYNKGWYSVEKRYTDDANNQGAHKVVAIYILNGTPECQILELLKELFKYKLKS